MAITCRVLAGLSHGCALEMHTSSPMLAKQNNLVCIILQNDSFKHGYLFFCCGITRLSSINSKLVRYSEWIVWPYGCTLEDLQQFSFAHVETRPLSMAISISPFFVV
jgi:hypothetical protein